jgi:hypothetical protein
MIESAYALSKYIDAKNKVFNETERSQIRFLFNIETVLGFSNIDEITQKAIIKDGVDGIVFGRGDYTLSKGMKRTEVDEDVITKECIEVATICKNNNLELIVGGGVSKGSINSLKAINNTCLTRFETRKIIFSANAINDNNIEQALKEALHFELLWLKNKQSYYSNIVLEDVKRIDILEKRGS